MKMASKTSLGRKTIKEKPLLDVDTYLTHLKELPPVGEEDSLKKSKVEEKRPFAEGGEELSSTKEDHPLGGKETVPREEDKDFGIMEEVEEKRKLPITVKDVILGIVNLISVVLLLIILARFPSKANELKNLRIENFKSKTDLSFEAVEIDTYKAKKAELQKFFLDDERIVEFVSQAGKFAKVSFANQEPVKDRTGNLGIPVVLEFSGSWEDIDKTLQAIDTLPFLFRAARIEIERSKEDPDVIKFKYGIFLYVDDEFGKS